MIDYFCHFMQRPADYDMIVANDKEFAKSEALQKIKWVTKEQEDIYVPSYTDVLRVSFTHIFQRGKIADLVNLLSGRNFETRENLEIIAEDSFRKLREGVEAFVNETNFKRYLMIVQSTGIVDSSLVRSKNVLNFGYILYLSLKDRGMHPATIESFVRRWIVLSMLTGRYSGSAESAIDYDIKRFTEQDPETFLKTTETGELSDAFWNTVLVQRLDTSVASSPYFLVFLMAQVKKNAGASSPNRSTSYDSVCSSEFEYQPAIRGTTELVVAELDVAACKLGVLLSAHDHVHGLRVDEYLST